MVSNRHLQAVFQRRDYESLPLIAFGKGGSSATAFAVGIPTSIASSCARKTLLLGMNT